MSRWAKLRHLVCSPFGKHHTNADSEGAQNELSKPPPSSKPKHAEATTLRLLVRKGSIVKGTHVPYLNQFLGMLYKVRWVYLATALAAIFILVAFVFGAIFKGLDCIDESYVKISVLTLLQLFGGNGMDSFVSDDLSCLGVACVVSALTIIIQALIVSVVTARFMNPTVKVRIADHLVCKSRNDKRVLQFRVSSRNGHPITDFKVECVWLCPETTKEGESFVKPVPLLFGGLGPTLITPTSYSHYIDEASPFYGMDDIRTCAGSILVLVGGTDSILRTEFDQIHLFTFREIEYDKTFVDCMEVSMMVAARMGVRTQWDLSRFDETQPV
eukprot:c12700_g1_i2.p1 GENE.c12700_g1_i2~~c12700_g1_i2.p1  ORF type:complete len:336 (-),score=69.14 c12700_g1_i2:121-1104(-)